MKSWHIAAAGLAVAALSASPARVPAQAPAEVNWLSDFDQACVEARRTGKPLFVAFR